MSRCATCALAKGEEDCAVNNCKVNSLNAKSSQPPVKKSRLLGDVDIHSPDIQKLIHAKSAHVSLVDEVLYIIYILLLVKYCLIVQCCNFKIICHYIFFI